MQQQAQQAINSKSLRVDHHIYRADSCSEAEDLYRREFGIEHSRTPLRRDKGEHELEILACGVSALSWTKCRQGSVVRASIPAPFVAVHLPTRHRAVYRIGRRRLVRNARNAVVLFPEHEYTLESVHGRHTSFLIPLPRLIEEIESRHAGLGRPHPKSCVEVPLARLGPMDLASDGRRILDEPHTNERIEKFRAWEAKAVARLARALLEQDGALAPSPTAVKLAEDIERWIREHLGESITLERLTAVAGVSDRWLQKSFLQRWGQTPLELVTSRRLAAVRARLTAAASDVSITTIAMESGFTHLGRFAAAYRSTFGELPSDTVSRIKAARRTS